MWKAHVSNNKVYGNDLPKFGKPDWPPSFQETTAILRAFLEDHCGDPSLWSDEAFRFQKAYFNRVFELHGTKVTKPIF